MQRIWQYRIGLTAWFVVLGLCLLSAGACAEPDRKAYQIQFGSAPPTTGAQALTSSSGRADTIIKFLGCGQEREFADGATLRVRGPDDKHPLFADAEDMSEGMLHKVAWAPALLTRRSNTRHRFGIWRAIPL
jgi:hypothetical protein